MTKHRILSAVIISIAILAAISCNHGKKTSNETLKVEVIPDDIVELREDQVRQAGIELGRLKCVH